MKSDPACFLATTIGVLVMMYSGMSLAEVNAPEVNAPEVNAAKIVASAFRLSSSAMVDNGSYPYRYSYCQPNLGGGMRAAKDLSPPLHWAGAPLATKSFALIVADLDAPIQVQAHQQIAATQARQTAYHWVLVNIPAIISRIPEAAGSKGFVPGGKQPGATPYGDAGINLYNDVLNSPDVTSLQFLKNKVYAGIYGQYDGPCPPWGDQKEHRYVFTLYALDVSKLDLPDNGMFTAAEALKAMRGHILAQSSLMVRYVKDVAGLELNES